MKKVILILVMLSLLFVYLPVVSVFAGETGIVKIFARDKDSGGAIPGASITVNNRTKIAGNNGARIWTLKKGWYSVGISSFKYLPYKGNIYVSKRKTSTTTVYLTKASVGSLEVTVKNENQMLLSGVRVNLGDAQAYTDGNGQASFTGLNSGTYGLSVSSTGYVDFIDNQVVIGSTTIFYNVVLTKNGGQPPTTGDLKVTISDESDVRISGASILVNGVTKSTNSNGEVSFAGLVAGDYVVKVAKFGFKDSTTSIAISSGGMTNLSLVLIDSEEPSGDLRIVLRDPSGQLISLALVTVDNTMSLTTNSLGEAIFTNLSIGNHIVRITKNGLLEITTVVNVGDGSNIIIYLTMNQDVTTLNGDLLIIVKSSSSTLLSGVLITVGSLSGYTDANGQIKFTGLAVNNYSLLATLSGYTPVNDTVSTASGDLVTFYVTMNPVSNASNSSLMVIVRSNGSSLLSGVLVTVGSVSGYTDASGTVTFSNLAVGDYPLTAILVGYTDVHDIASTVNGEQVTFYMMMFPKLK